jgi:hypothetical protein
MRSDFDPPSFAPDDRFREVAALPAAGLIRLHARAAAADPTGRPAAEELSNSSPNCLELPGAWRRMNKRFAANSGLPTLSQDQEMRSLEAKFAEGDDGAEIPVAPAVVGFVSKAPDEFFEHGVGNPALDPLERIDDTDHGGPLLT